MSLQLSVLVVDDEYSLRKSLSIILAKAGYSVQLASSVTQAQALLCNHHFDLVLLDYKLQDGLGTSLLPLIARQMPPPRVAILAALPRSSHKIDPCTQGVDIYLEKPCDPEEILKSARRLLER